ncbi:hypothetical protein BS17DRAFT_548845 [Gyrodon lividus]|nr:hypothetical protein BS17DRAFT_548845 [Gyrodon lividus]
MYSCWESVGQATTWRLPASHLFISHQWPSAPYRNSNTTVLTHSSPTPHIHLPSLVHSILHRIPGLTSPFLDFISVQQCALTIVVELSVHALHLSSVSCCRRVSWSSAFPVASVSCLPLDPPSTSCFLGNLSWNDQIVDWSLVYSCIYRAHLLVSFFSYCYWGFAEGRGCLTQNSSAYPSYLT